MLKKITAESFRYLIKIERERKEIQKYKRERYRSN